MEQINKFTIKHSLDFRMSATKDKPKKKMHKSSFSHNAADSYQVQKSDINLPQRVFLYLHPKSISFPQDDIPSGRMEIEVEHNYNTITTLSDRFMPRNVIQVDQFEIEKPTFSITIEQDSIEDVTMLSDSPVMLTLYVHAERKSFSGEISENDFLKEDKEERKLNDIIRIPVAQGYIDIMDYFNQKRSRSTDTVYLYPLKAFGQTLTCKTEWEIYSLHPLLKNISITNVLFITFGSIYNINQDLMNACEELEAKLSFISKMPNENNEYDKIFICKFTTFTKSTISQQNLTKTWESLKYKEFENFDSIGIASESKFNLNQLFTNLFCTENVELNLGRIDITEDVALICNSMHRYVLTDVMHKVLEDILSKNKFQIIVEIYAKRSESEILLQGYIDLSIFMYPEVKNCSFAIELRPTGYESTVRNSTKHSLKGENVKMKSKNQNKYQKRSSKDDKIPFAIIQICIQIPITYPPQDINVISSQKHHKYGQCTTTVSTKTTQMSLYTQCQRNYKQFDDLMREIVDYIYRNNIKTINDDKKFFCSQLSNISNRLMKLVACDFNRRIPTKTNIEFTNLITTVYKELINRIYDFLNKCSHISPGDCGFTMTSIQNFIVTNMTMIKYLYEVGNLDIADYLLAQLRTKYQNNSLLNFYILLYDIERQNFELVEEYLKKPLDDKDLEGELFTELIRIYIDYKLQLQDSEKYQTADENLIKQLSDYSLHHSPPSLTGWVLLYCLYKKYNYEPGMSYCRWKYENLFESFFVKLQFIPKSRWEIYMPHKIYLKSIKGQNFVKVFDKLLNLGLYTFAEFVFEEIKNELLEIERYFLLSTFMILNNKVQDKFVIKTFSVEKLTNYLEMHAILSLVNGNLEYSRLANSPESIKHYKDLIELKELKDICYYKLGLLRFAYKMMDEKNYEKAIQAFLCCYDENNNCIVAAIGRGKACYYQGELEEAEKYFALSTKYDLYIPNTWAYLALINLKIGKNYNALECWKYARLNKNTKIDEEIMHELNKINISDIFLYVDVPNNA